VNARTYKHSRLSLARSLKLAQLVVFEKVVEAGSILAASRELAMTQPAVSKSIHELERHLDAPLFVRGKRGVTLTEFGQKFESDAKSMLAELRRMVDGLNAWQTGAAGQVVVGTLITGSATLLPEAITRLRKASPDVRVEVRVGPNTILFPGVARGDLDIVVGFLPAAFGPPLRMEDSARLTHVKLYEEALCIVMDRRQALAQRRKLSLRELHGMDWILPTSDSVAYAPACALFDKAGLAMPQRVVNSVSVLTNIGLLTRGPMIAVMPRSGAEPFVRAGLLSFLRLGPLGSIGTVGYTIRTDRTPSPSLQRFILALEEACPDPSVLRLEEPGGPLVQVKERPQKKKTLRR